MMSSDLGPYFDDDGGLLIKKADGRSVCVQLSKDLLRADGVFQGGRYLAGAFMAEYSGGSTKMHVDLLCLVQPWSVQRWDIDNNGICTEPRDIDLTVGQPVQSNYLVSPKLIDLLKKQFNDLEIYTVLRMLCGRYSANEYLKNCVAAHRPDSGSSCRLVIIFNHHYIRNCRALHDFYASRFPDIDFVLPCAAPKHPNYYAYPFGSYQFHGLIHGYLQSQLRENKSGIQNYVFIQDDVLLHPRITVDAINELLSAEYGVWFPFDWKYDRENDKWQWAQRIRNALDKQMDPLIGNGFEGLASMVWTQHLRHGVSDCFGLRSSLVREFIDRLAPLVAANLFPELAIPTALFNTASASGLRVVNQEGTLLWQEQRAQVYEPAFINTFLESNSAFLHPVKIGDGNHAVLQSVRNWHLKDSSTADVAGDVMV